MIWLLTLVVLSYITGAGLSSFYENAYKLEKVKVADRDKEIEQLKRRIK